MCTLKSLQISILKIIHCDLVNLCHGFCISYGLAHVLSECSLFQVSHTKTINTANFLASCDTPLKFSLDQDLYMSSPKFQILQFLGRIHTNRYINLLL